MCIVLGEHYCLHVDLNKDHSLRGGPQLSSFSFMIISIVRGGWLKNDDKYHDDIVRGGVEKL